MNRKEAQEFINEFDFAGYRLRTKGLGVYFLSDETKKNLASLSKERLKEINKSCWKEIKVQNAIANRNSNFSTGNIDRYDIASLRYEVSKAIAKHTWMLMNDYIKG